MEYIADLHIHSKYSRACSKGLDVFNLEKYARMKGLGLLGTSDFTHPKWFEHLKENLIEDGSGMLRTKTGFPFLLSSEISLIYKQDAKCRKVHNLFFAKDLEVAGQINDELKRRGRVDYDGRPIFGMSCPEFVELLKDIDDKNEIIPAHIWTPWFSMFGSKSGFDTVKECFQDQTKHIYALETGLSSDPEMNWRLSQLDKYTLISNSDSHAYWPWRLGREANVFEFDELNYDNVIKALHTKEGFKETIEVDPAYGKYHFDGHRKCNVSMAPQMSSTMDDICPVCKKPMVLGVLHRVEELADRPSGYRPIDAVPFRSLMPLSEVIAMDLGCGVDTKKVWAIYNALLQKFGSEYNVLLETDPDNLLEVVSKRLADLIIMNREKGFYVTPGYDGVYGKANPE